MVRLKYFYKLPDGTYVDTEGDPGVLGYVKVGERLGLPIYTKPELVPEPVAPPPPPPEPEPIPLPPEPFVPPPEAEMVTAEEFYERFPKLAPGYEPPPTPIEVMARERIAAGEITEVSKVYIEATKEQETALEELKAVKEEVRGKEITPEGAEYIRSLETYVSQLGEQREAIERYRAQVERYGEEYITAERQERLAEQRAGIELMEERARISKLAYLQERAIEIERRAEIESIVRRAGIPEELQLKAKIALAEGKAITYIPELPELVVKEVPEEPEPPKVEIFKLLEPLVEERERLEEEVPEWIKRVATVGVGLGVGVEPVTPREAAIVAERLLVGGAKMFTTWQLPVGIKLKPAAEFFETSPFLREPPIEWKRVEFLPGLKLEPTVTLRETVFGLTAGLISGIVTVEVAKKGVEVVSEALRTLRIDIDKGLGRTAKKAVAKTKTAVKKVKKVKKEKVKEITITKEMLERGLPIEEVGITERFTYTVDEIKTLMKYQPAEAKKLATDAMKTSLDWYKEMLALEQFDQAAKILRGMRKLKSLMTKSAFESAIRTASTIKARAVKVSAVKAEAKVISDVAVAGITVSKVGVLAKSTVSTKTSPAVTTMLKPTIISRVARKAKVITVQRQIQLQREAQAQEQKRRQLLLLGVTQLQKPSAAVATMLKEKVKEEEIIIPYEPTPSPPYEPTPTPPYKPPKKPPKKPPVTPPYEPTPEPPYEPTKAPPKKPPKRPPRIPRLPWWQFPRPRIIRRRVPIREELKPVGIYQPSITAVYERIIVRKPLKQTIFAPTDIRPVVLTKKEKEEERKRRKRLAARAKVRDILKPSITGKPSKAVARISLKPSIKFGVKAPKKGGIREALKQSVKF